MATGSVFTRQIKECQNMLSSILEPSASNSDSLAVVRKIIRCDECFPRQAAVCSVELRFFCMNHFVAYCYRRLEECEKGWNGRQSRESVRSFLRECATQAAKLLLMRQEVQNADRARLFDIMLWSNEMLYRSISKISSWRTRIS